MVRLTGEDVLNLVFRYFIKRKNNECALKVAKVLLLRQDVKLVLGIGDIDWEIQTAIEKVGAEVTTSPSNANIAYFDLYQKYHELDENKFNSFISKLEDD